MSVPATATELRQLRAAVVALADENAALWAVIASAMSDTTPDPQEVARQQASEHSAVALVRRQQAPAIDVDQFAEQLRKSATAVGFAGPPQDANAHTRELREQIYKARWPRGSEDEDARPKSRRRRGLLR